MAVQVKFDRSKTNAEALAASTQSANSSTIFFTTDDNNHQIIINGVTYGGTPHAFVESTYPLCDTLDSFKAATGKDSIEAAIASEVGQMILATIYKRKEGDFFVYKKFIAASKLEGKYTAEEATEANAKHQGDPNWESVKMDDPKKELRYEYTAYVCDGATNIQKTDDTYDIPKSAGVYVESSLGVWRALDGNYDARNVFLHDDIIMAGSYTQVGNKTKTVSGTATFSTKGKSVQEVFEEIFTKLEWPANITYNTTIDGPAQSTFSYPSLPSLVVKNGGTTLTNGGTRVVEVGSSITIDAATYSTKAPEDVTFSNNSYTARTEGLIVSLTGQNWGLSEKAITEATGTTYPSTKSSGWSDTGNSMTFTWARTGGEGYLKMEESNTNFGTTTWTDTQGASNNNTWSEGAAAATYKTKAGAVTAQLGTVTYTLSKKDTDSYTRTASPATLTTKTLDSYYLVNNLGTTAENKKTDAKSSVDVTDGNKTASGDGSEASAYITLHAVYPLLHNGSNSSAPDKNSETANVKATGLYDVHGSSAYKIYTVYFASGTSSNKIIKSPAYDATHYCYIALLGKDGQGLYTVNKLLEADGAASGGYQQYKNVSTDSANSFKIVIAKTQAGLDAGIAAAK